MSSANVEGIRAGTSTLAVTAGPSAILLVHCPDKKGLVAAITGLVSAHSGNILSLDQHVDSQESLFFMRLEWALEGFDMERFQREFSALAWGMNMQWQLRYSAHKPAVAIMVSRYPHCLADLLHRHQDGELACTIPFIVSNHTDTQSLAAFHGIPFHHIPVTGATKAAAEEQHRKLMEDHNVDLIVLARYMQILSPAFVARYPGRIINVHHSFLPAFTGAKPYHAAFERGVKLIGATSHYVTDALDEGPIIEQSVTRISHRDQLEKLIEKGRDSERMVLSRAVKWHIEGRILRYANRTVIFE